MSTGEHMTYFLKKDSYIPSYTVFPRYLFRMEISETAKLIYVLLLDRARLSLKNEGWVNEFVMCSSTTLSRIWRRTAARAK